LMQAFLEMPALQQEDESRTAWKLRMGPVIAQAIVSLGITREMIAAFDLLDEVDLCDEGPVGEGWRSAERDAEVFLLNDARDILTAVLNLAENTL